KPICWVRPASPYGFHPHQLQIADFEVWWVICLHTPVQPGEFWLKTPLTKERLILLKIVIVHH
uniref:hypothetical protein n=1 Tax=Candidatus Wunengus sp. YC61 TaxID=3367698 RepID=UPI00402513C8